MHFGLQGCQMCLQFKWGDIELKVDTAGEYLDFNEDQLKWDKARPETTFNYFTWKFSPQVHLLPQFSYATLNLRCLN